MQYALLIYTKPGTMESLSPDEQAAVRSDYIAFTSEPGIVGGAGLEGVETATCVRAGDGDQLLVTDGPFADTKEVFAGYYVLEAPDLDAATKAAARIRRCVSAARSRSGRS